MRKKERNRKRKKDVIKYRKKETNEKQIKKERNKERTM